MAKCIFEGLTTKQAKILAQWYEGQGEQNADEWFEAKRCAAPLADVGRKGGFMEVLDNGDVVAHCK